MYYKNDTKELEKYISDIKRDLLFHIISDIRESKLTLGEAKYLAKDFLALLPAQNKGEVLDKLYSLTGLYREAKYVFAKYIVTYEEEKTAKKLALIREYMQKGDYEQAVESTKGVI